MRANRAAAGMPSIIKNNKACLVCGHRGASGQAPENTSAAFRLAIDMGADMCELDVQQTRDDRFAVIHDVKLGRTTDGRGLVWKQTLAELQELDAGGWFGRSFAGEHIPALEEVMAISRGRIRLNIELKVHGHERQVAELLMATIRRENFVNDCMVSSFDHRLVNQIKSLAPELTAGYTFSKREFDERLFAGPAEFLSAHFPLITDDFMKRAHACGKQVHAWTVNRTEDMQRLLDSGIDVIITNFPEQFMRLLGSGTQ